MAEVVTGSGRRGGACVTYCSKRTAWCGGQETRAEGGRTATRRDGARARRSHAGRHGCSGVTKCYVLVLQRQQQRRWPPQQRCASLCPAAARQVSNVRGADALTCKLAQRLVSACGARIQARGGSQCQQRLVREYASDAHARWVGTELWRVRGLGCRCRTIISLPRHDPGKCQVPRLETGVEPSKMGHASKWWQGYTVACTRTRVFLGVCRPRACAHRPALRAPLRAAERLVRNRGTQALHLCCCAEHA